MDDGYSTFGAKSDHLDRLVFEAMIDDEVQEQARCASSVDRSKEKIGHWIGRYKLVKVLGEGGMGIVYLAEQVEPVRRHVALKVIKPGMDSKRVVARFDAERQALALLDHPNISQVHDGGTTAAGHPYFVMEYVRGLPITEYCDEHKLSIDQRLRLFQEVCHAVQHAHQKGIIHRDIKPSNILVSEKADKPVPKIIDFGVAKAIGKSLTEMTLFTDETRLLGTPEYMSPEQADMATEDVDTRSDVYSLGVLLYVLLAGLLPFDTKALRKHGIDHIRRTIRQSDPKTPASRLAKLGQEARAVAERRCTEVATLARRLRNELGWIPLKAMRKERSERYQSASELADDVENYLRGIPLLAGPPGALYHLRKFVRRNAAMSLAVLVVAVTLVLGLAGATAMYLRAEMALRKESMARDDAERALTQARAVSDFLVEDILGDHNFPEGWELHAKDILDNTRAKLEGRFADQPLVEARIRKALGQRFLTIGRAESAREEFDRAYQIYVKSLGPEDFNTIKTANMICWAYWDLNRHQDAIAMWNDQIRLIRRAYGEGTKWGMLFMSNIGQTYTYLGRYDEAETWFAKTLELCECWPQPFVFFVARLHLAANYMAQGCFAEAKQLLSQILEERPGSTQWRVLSGQIMLSQVFRTDGQYARAQQLCEETLDTLRQTLGQEHSLTLRAMRTLGEILMDRGEFDEAEVSIRNAMRLQRHKFGNEHHETLESINALAVLLTRRGMCDEAEMLFSEVLKGRQSQLGDDHPRTLATLNHLGELYRQQGRYVEAERLSACAFEGRRDKLGPTHPACFELEHEPVQVRAGQEVHAKTEPRVSGIGSGR